MKKLLIAALAVLAVAGLALNAVAAEPVVFGITDGGCWIPNKGATLVTSKPEIGQANKPQKIHTSADVGPVLGISFSATDIAWTVRAPGKYQANAIDITITNNMLASPQIKLSDVGNLKGPGGEVKAFYDVGQYKINSGPMPLKSVEEINSNGGDIMPPICVPEWRGVIASGIEVDKGTKPGKYADDFYVTVVQKL